MIQKVKRYLSSPGPKPLVPKPPTPNLNQVQISSKTHLVPFRADTKILFDCGKREKGHGVVSENPVLCEKLAKKGKLIIVSCSCDRSRLNFSLDVCNFLVPRLLLIRPHYCKCHNIIRVSLQQTPFEMFRPVINYSRPFSHFLYNTQLRHERLS